MRFTHSRKINYILILLFVALYCPNEARAEFAGGVFKQGVCYIFGWMEGDLGALLAVAAGVVAVFMGAAGNFKGVAAFVMTAIGAYTISNSVEFYFGSFNCGGVPAAAGRQAAALQVTPAQNNRVATPTFSAVSQLPQDDSPPSFPARGTDEPEQF